MHDKSIDNLHFFEFLIGCLISNSHFKNLSKVKQNIKDIGNQFIINLIIFKSYFRAKNYYFLCNNPLSIFVPKHMRKLPKLLIVENNIGDIILLKLAIKELGLEFDIYETETAEEGLKYLNNNLAAYGENRLPELIITDLSMPGIGGMEFLQIVKKSTTFKQIPIVIMTTSSKISDQQNCLKFGAEEYVIKPMFLDEYVENFIFLRKFAAVGANG